MLESSFIYLVSKLANSTDTLEACGEGFMVFEDFFEFLHSVRS